MEKEHNEKMIKSLPRTFLDWISCYLDWMISRSFYDIYWKIYSFSREAFLNLLSIWLSTENSLIYQLRLLSFEMNIFHFTFQYPNMKRIRFEKGYHWEGNFLPFEYMRLNLNWLECKEYEASQSSIWLPAHSVEQFFLLCFITSKRHGNHPHQVSSVTQSRRSFFIKFTSSFRRKELWRERKRRVGVLRKKANKSSRTQKFHILTLPFAQQIWEFHCLTYCKQTHRI